MSNKARKDELTNERGVGSVQLESADGMLRCSRALDKQGASCMQDGGGDSSWHACFIVWFQAEPLMA